MHLTVIESHGEVQRVPVALPDGMLGRHDVVDVDFDFRIAIGTQLRNGFHRIAVHVPLSGILRAGLVAHK